MLDVRYWVKTGIAVTFAFITLYLAFLFFTAGVNLINQAAVFAGIISVVVGFAFLSASVTLIRDWVLGVRAEQASGRKGQ